MNSRTLGTKITKIKFKNNHVVYENFIKCTVKDYEFNLSYNPTLLSGSQTQLYAFSSSVDGDVFYEVTGSSYFGILKDFTTGSISGSEFSPYVTTVGLYNDAGDLLAIGKMAAPMPLSTNTDVTFLVKWDTQWNPKPYFTPTPTPTSTPPPPPSVSKTPSVTPSIFKTPSVTPSMNTSPNVTPSVTSTPSVSIGSSPQATPSRTPSLTPTITQTPSLTPTPTPSKTYYYYFMDQYLCPDCNNSTGTIVGYANESLNFGKFYNIGDGFIYTPASETVEQSGATDFTDAPSATNCPNACGIPG